MVKLSQVKTCYLLNLLKSVNKSIAVNKELSRGFRNIEVVFEEALNCKEGFLVKTVDRAALEYLLKEGFTKGSRQLIDKAGNTEIIVGNDGLIGIKYLSDLKGGLSLLKGTGKVLKIRNGGADTDNGMDIRFTRKGIRNRGRKVFNILGLDTNTCFLNKSNICFVYVDNKILGLFGEKILKNIINRNIVRLNSTDKDNGALNIAVKIQFTRLKVNIPRQNIIKNYVLNEVCAVILFIIVELNIRESNRDNRGILSRNYIVTLNKNGVLGTLCGTYRLKGVATENKNTASLVKGASRVAVKGVNGKVSRVYRTTFLDGDVCGKEVLSESVISNPVNQVVEHGTNTNYSTKTVKNARFKSASEYPVTNNAEINKKLVSPLAPDTPIQLDKNGRPVSYKQCITGVASAYSPVDGKWTATGALAQVGYIAVDPKQIPYGTLMYIKCVNSSYIYGYAIAADCGAFKQLGRTVDLFFPSASAAVQFGVRNVEIYIL